MIGNLIFLNTIGSIKNATTNKCYVNVGEAKSGIISTTDWAPELQQGGGLQNLS